MDKKRLYFYGWLKVQMCIRDSPNTVSYMKGKDIDYYINQAGGYSENAKRSKKFIVYMNGCLLYTSTNRVTSSRIVRPVRQCSSSVR